MAAAEKRLMDIECFPNYFLVGAEDYDSKIVTNFEISEEKDDRLEICNYFNGYEGFLITFNGIYYDNPVINYLRKNIDKLMKLTPLETCIELKKFSDQVINNDYDNVKGYTEKNPTWMDIDFFLYWSMFTRRNKKISLKSLAIQLNHEEIQELPFHHTTELTLGEKEEIKRYNNINDLGILRKLFDKQIEEVRLRRFIKYEYGISCWSHDAPKIVSELLLTDYCESTGNNWWDIKGKKHNPYTGTIGKLLHDVQFDFKHPKLREVYDEILKSTRDFKMKFVINHPASKTNIKISLGIGGIHSLLENKKFVSEKGRIIRSSDVQSMYPNLIVNYKLCRYPEVLKKYAEVKAERVIAKKQKLKQKDTLLKLILNSFSGLIDEPYSWLYYPQGALKLRILGQLLELKALDECLAKNYQVLALNTDSIDVLINKDQIEEYDAVIDNLGKEYNLIFEHENIEWTNYQHINSYIQKAEGGKIKRKGLFRYGDDIPLGDPVNEQIIPKALELFFDKGIKVEESITNPEKYGFHIYDYCVSKKISKDYEVFHNSKKVQNLNRYYFSKSGAYLYKRKNTKTTMENVHKGDAVKLFNTYIEYRLDREYYADDVDGKPKLFTIDFEKYNINYAYYIGKCNDILYNLHKDEIQLSLF